MEKFNWFTSLLDKWIELSDKKKLSYITGAIIILSCLAIYIMYWHYENKITKLENEKIELKNEYTIARNSDAARDAALLRICEDEKKAYIEAHIKYIEKNEEQVRDILFYTKKYKKGK